MQSTFFQDLSRRRPRCRQQIFFFLFAAFFTLFSFGALALFLPLDIQAQTQLSKADESVLSGFANRYKGLNTLKAAYIRSTVTPSSDPVFKNQASQTAVGTLFWKKPYNLRLDQVSPEKEEMVVDGSAAWWYIPKEKTAHVYRNLDLESEYFSLMSFFDGVDELKKKFNITVVPPEEARGTLKGFVLTPLEENGSGAITIFCDSDYKLQGFRMNSATGEKTDFFLNYLEPNPTLAASLFEFKPPKGTEVVEESGE
jgi:outer membrane lipoprotein carrier protein